MFSGLLFFVTAAVALAFANAGSIPSADDVTGNLYLFTMTAEKIGGVYFNEEGGGIHLISKSDSIYIGTWATFDVLN